MPIRIDHDSGDRFTVTIRGHHIVVDQPLADGGEDHGPTPTELFVASLGACIAFYANRALRGAQMRDGLPGVSLSFTMSPTPPSRVQQVAIAVAVPSDITEARLAAVRRAVASCTVHNSIKDGPQVDVTVMPAARTALHTVSASRAGPIHAWNG